MTDFILVQDFWKTLFDGGTVKYVFAGEEVCPETQRIHWQMYVCFKSQRSAGSVIKLLRPRHVEPMRGSLRANAKYCEKEGNPAFEYGDKPAQGTRTDLIEIADDIKNGKRVRQILEEDPMAYHKYGRTMERLEDTVLSRRHRDFMTQGVWYFGPTGTGKSHVAFSDYTPETHYVYPVRDKGWWDGYQQQDTVIINDFRGEIPYAEMLQLVDKWPHSVPRRCREPIPFLSKTVIVTSSQEPGEVYNRRDEEDSIEQLLRRFEVHRCLTKYKE